MLEKEKIGYVMNILIEDCCVCPLERICEESECSKVWAKFLGTKVREDGVE